MAMITISIRKIQQQTRIYPINQVSQPTRSSHAVRSAACFCGKSLESRITALACECTVDRDTKEVGTSGAQVGRRFKQGHMAPGQVKWPPKVLSPAFPVTAKSSWAAHQPKPAPAGYAAVLEWRNDDRGASEKRHGAPTFGGC